MAEIGPAAVLDSLEVNLNPFRGGSDEAHQPALGLLYATGQAGAKGHVAGSHHF